MQALAEPVRAQPVQVQPVRAAGVAASAHPRHQVALRSAAVLPPERSAVVRQLVRLAVVLPQIPSRRLDPIRRQMQPRQIQPLRIHRAQAGRPGSAPRQVSRAVDVREGLLRSWAKLNPRPSHLKFVA